MVASTLPAADVEDAAYEIKKLIGLCQWIEQARKVVDTIHYVSTHSERGAEARGALNLVGLPDWDDLQSEGLDLLLSKIYAAAGDLEEDAMKAAADAEELSPDAFDALSPAGQLHHLAEWGLRCLPEGRRTDQSRRCLNQMVAMLADELEDEREQAEQIPEAEEKRRRAEEESRCREDRLRELHSHLQLAWSANP